MKDEKKPEKLKRVASAVGNMSALIDDMVRKARKSFKETGDAELDAKFLKESVSALRELYGLLGECDPTTEIDEGIVIRLEKQVEEWSK